ncbi:uncharacterized protein B0H18DRAFT_600898 [Fomitopsis serialis]|uniref:uncharacterized protein n=1 Tax=Fomitopsis serialis TaxID=139415 RepID=UPI0020080EE2|nr:uncharacterized protein B0H18DRAFT_600898 [Neoantrodia serialis]KAH9933764.1 hypothetical protein B0H18DRAFT_600898 [Neoantrodia serialis]
MRKGKFKVFIKSEGRELSEYQVEAVDDKTVACYIPSEVGKTFEICWRGDTRGDSHITSVRCHVDGRNAGGKPSQPGLVKNRRWGVRVATDQRSPFVFASLALTDDDTSIMGSEAHPDLGTIDVTLAHVIHVGNMPIRDTSNEFTALTVHERSKKMGTQCVSLDEARRCDLSTFWKQSKLVDENIPFYARFIFRYRFKDYLQAEGIMPLNGSSGSGNAEQPYIMRERIRVDYSIAGSSRKKRRTDVLAAPSAPQADVRSPATRLTEDEDVVAIQNELDSVQQRAQILQSKLRTIQRSGSSRRVKREQQDPNEDVVDLTRGNVKRERSPTSLQSNGGVIDLTLDDD